MIIVVSKKHGNKNLNITERKLGQHRAWGLYWHKRKKIEIDPSQMSKKYLTTLIHELVHMNFPDLTEEGVIKAANLISKGVWQQGYRRIYK